MQTRSSIPLVAALLLMTAGSLVGQEDPNPAGHVVLVSMDGLRPEFYLDPDWPAPMLQRMAREGAHARGVRGVFPTVTYPSHTTLITGARPARHGVPANRPFEAEGQTGRWYWEASSVKAETLFEAVREAGGTTAALSWPVTVGAPIDWNIPEYWSLDEDADPATVLRTVEHPEGLLDEMEREVVGRLAPWKLSTDHISFEDRTAAMAAHVLVTRKPRFLAVHLIAADHFQHREGRSGETVTLSVAAVDRALAVLVEAAERAGILDRTAFVVVGDHGFIDLHTLLYPNHWLVEAGLHGDEPDRGDWRAAFHSSGGVAYLYLRRPGDGRTLEAVRQVLDALPDARRRLFRVLDRAEIARLGGDPEAALALAAVPGVYFNERTGRGEIGPLFGGGHGYHPDEHPDILTGFVAWGAGIRPGATIPVLAMEDIAPTVAELMGVALDAPDGALVPGIIQ